MGSESDVSQAIRKLLDQNGFLTVAELADETGLSRQALHRHLSRALKEGRLQRTGRGRATRYERRAQHVFRRTYPTAGLQEDSVQQELDRWLAQVGSRLTPSASSILYYVVTEMVNNAIDHSGAPAVQWRQAPRSPQRRVQRAHSWRGQLYPDG